MTCDCWWATLIPRRVRHPWSHMPAGRTWHRITRCQDLTRRTPTPTLTSSCLSVELSQASPESRAASLLKSKTLKHVRRPCPALVKQPTGSSRRAELEQNSHEWGLNCEKELHCIHYDLPSCQICVLSPPSPTPLPSGKSCLLAKIRMMASLISLSLMILWSSCLASSILSLSAQSTTKMSPWVPV